MYSHLLQPITIRNKTIKNRVCFPPVGLAIDGNEDGSLDKRKHRLYLEIAQGGAGLITVGYTAVQENGRHRPEQAGLWCNEQIPSFQSLTNDLHKNGTTVFVQLHHAAVRTMDSISLDKVAPSKIEGFPVREITTEEIHQLRNDFIAAAVRAKKAGFDGVELHAAHGYMLSLFASPMYNHRTDNYGGSLENRIRIQTEIICGIHEACGPDFIVGSRIGGNEPTYTEGVQIAMLLEREGADYLSVSFGMDQHYNLTTPYWKPTPWPDGFRGNSVVYAASLIKQQISIPVIAVRSICTAERGEWLLEHNHADIIAYARPMLVTPHFVRNIQNGIEPASECLDCPCCKWFLDPRKCPIEKNTVEIFFSINNIFHPDIK